eukprot:g39214.t1
MHIPPELYDFHIPKKLVPHVPLSVRNVYGISAKFFRFHGFTQNQSSIPKFKYCPESKFLPPPPGLPLRMELGKPRKGALQSHSTAPGRRPQQQIISLGRRKRFVLMRPPASFNLKRVRAPQHSSSYGRPTGTDTKNAKNNTKLRLTHCKLDCNASVSIV